MINVLVFPFLLNMCFCGSKVDVFGTHGLFSRYSGNRIPRHATLNETICSALVYLEPVGVCRDDRKKPDGLGGKAYPTLGLHLFRHPRPIECVYFLKWCQLTGKLSRVCKGQVVLF